jgi:2-oxoisovalerate dehydrogenase E1 component
MLRESVRLAREEQRIVVFVEPIALYNMRDLHDVKDAQWMQMYPSPDQSIPLGSVGVTGGGPLAIVTYGNGHYLSQIAAKKLADQNIETRIIDMRWLSPMPTDGILAALNGAQKVLIVDECRTTGSQSEGLMAMLSENSALPKSRIAAEDSFIATGPAYAATMPSVESIVGAAISLWETS